MSACNKATARDAVGEVVMIWRSGPDMGCIDFSESWLKFAGRSYDEELGDGWAQRVHPDDLTRCLEVYQSAFVARREFQMEYRLQRYDGVYRWILDIGTPEWNADGRFLGYVGSCVDVSEAHTSGSDALIDSLAALDIARGNSIDLLTPRERAVSALLARGLSNQQIAAELVISVATVRVHVEHILDKLGLHSRAQVAAWMVGQRSRVEDGAAHPVGTWHDVAAAPTTSVVEAGLVRSAQDHRLIELLVRAEDILIQTLSTGAASQALRTNVEQLLADTRRELAAYRTVDTA